MARSLRMARIAAAPRLARSASSRTARLAPLLAPAALVFCAAWPSTAPATVTPAGAEFEVVPASDFNGVPAVCTRPDGGFVVAHPYGDVNDSRILARRLDASGKQIGVGLVVSTKTEGLRIDPDVACGPDGGFAIVWTDRSSRPDDTRDQVANDILARVYDANGLPLSQPFVVNVWTTGSQQSSAVCAQGGGQYAVVWQDRSRDELDTRIVSAAGPVAGAVRAADDPRPFTPPDAACAGDGRFLAVWGDFPSQAANDEVVARVFASNGSPVGSSFFVNGYTTGDQSFPSACGLADGGFVVTWRDASSRSGAAGQIIARDVSRDGATVGDDFAVSPQGRARADVVCGSAGGFVVATLDTGDMIDTLRAQAIAADRSFAGNERGFFAGSTILTDEGPPASGDGDGRFVIVWPKVLDSGAVTIRGRFFDNVGAGGPTTTLPPPSSTLPPPTTTQTLPPPTTTTTSSTTSSTTTTQMAMTTSTLQATSTTAIVATTTSTLFDVRPRACGDPAPPDGITVVDALVILRAATGDGTCEPCVCDVDSSGSIGAGDALRVLRIAVGLPSELNCPPCV